MFKKFKPELTTLGACHRLALIEGQKENKTVKKSYGGIDEKNRDKKDLH